MPLIANRPGDRGEVLGRIGLDEDVAVGSDRGRRDIRLCVLGDRVDVDPAPRPASAPPASAPDVLKSVSGSAAVTITPGPLPGEPSVAVMFAPW